MPTTKHTHPVVFGRREPGCPRCAELAAGAPPVRWAWAERAKARREQEARELAALRHHFRHECSPATCGPVCTRGDW